MRAGPRSTQYFDPRIVRADIVCSGKATPGINNIIRELVTILKETYKVEKVTGVRFSFRGYYNNDMIDLTSEMVETIHHKGGSFLGLASCQCNAELIVDSL
jgi:6-phosphofructokinase 1